MSTRHQDRRRVRLDHDTDWTVVVDPPHEFRFLKYCSSRALADAYMRGLKKNNPRAAAHAYILGPRLHLKPAKR